MAHMAPRDLAAASHADSGRTIAALPRSLASCSPCVRGETLTEKLATMIFRSRVEREYFALGCELLIIVDDVELSQRTTGLMLSLFEVIYFERDPLEKIDSVLAVALAGPVDEYRDALDQALASSVRLANLGPEYHPEVIVRRLLAEVRRRLSVLN
jgi:hypothetical protein